MLDVLLMFGFVVCMFYLCIEICVCNVVIMLWFDVVNVCLSKCGIVGVVDVMIFGLYIVRLLCVVCLIGIDVCFLCDVGVYFCNYLSWCVIEWVCVGGLEFVVFVYIFLFVCSGVMWCKGVVWIMFEELVDVGEVMLLEMVQLLWKVWNISVSQVGVNV